MKQNVKVNTPIHIRPASPEEAGLFYSELDETADERLAQSAMSGWTLDLPEKDSTTHGGPTTMTSSTPRNSRVRLQEVVDMLRADGPLKDLASMRSYCYRNGGEITEDGRCYGYVVDTEHYRYCLRCTPSPGDYQGYLYCYDLRQQQMARQAKPVGRVTFADGSRMDYTDVQEYLRCIQKELPQHSVTGFRYETLTDDPVVRKQVDDILFDLYGEENPQSLTDYENSSGQGMKMGGM